MLITTKKDPPERRAFNQAENPLFLKWSRESDSNRRPTHYECVALPTELSRQNTILSLYIKIMQPTIGEIEIYQGVQID